MSWNTYWTEAMRGVDDAEERVDRTWRRSAAEIAAVVWWLRRRVTERSVRLPIVDGGWIDITDRRALGRFRLDVAADVEKARRDLSLALSGGQRHMVGAVSGTLRGIGITPEAVIEGAVAFRPNWERLEAIRARFEREVERALDSRDRIARPGPFSPPPPTEPQKPPTPTPQQPPSARPGQKPTKPPSPGQSPGSPPAGSAAAGQGSQPPATGPRPVIPDGIPPAKLAEIERELARAAKDKRTKTAREAADQLEIGVDALANIARNLRFDLERLYETTVRMTGPRSRPEAMRDYLGGQKPWSLNENNMRLSTSAHVRGIHRRRTVTEGTASGITHYRLDLPRQRLGDIGPGSQLSPYLWTVRPLSEWNDIADHFNRSRKSASSFDTLGFFHNDPSYVVPVPPVFLLDAEKHGAKLREKWGLIRGVRNASLA